MCHLLRNVVKSAKRLHQIAGIMLPLEYRGWPAIEPKQLIGGCHGRAHGILDSKHDIFGQLAELPRNRKVDIALRMHLWSIAFGAGQKLTGNERHHARQADRYGEDRLGALCHTEVSEELSHQLPSRAFAYRLAHKVSGLIH